jgi:hypothetical protein
MSEADLEVVWPLDRWHYLSVPEEEVMTPEPALADPLAPAQALAARAFLAGAGCTQARVGVLLDTNRRRIGRLVATERTTAVQEAAVLAQARACLTASETRGSTMAEREAAEAWLLQAERDGRPTEPASAATMGKPRTRPASKPARRAATGTPKTRAQRPAAMPAPPTAVPRRASLALEQVEALTREQQRLARRSLILGCAVTTLDPAPLREALADLVTEIAESARVIGMLLRPAG